MRTVFDSHFARAVKVTDTQGTRVRRAFLRPESLRRPETPEMSPAGISDERRWLLIMEADDLQGPVTITDGNREYILMRRELIGGDHIEGLLCLKAGDGDAE